MARLYWKALGELAPLSQRAAEEHAPTHSLFLRWPFQPSYETVGDNNTKIVHRIADICLFIVLHPLWKYRSSISAGLCGCLQLSICLRVWRFTSLACNCLLAMCKKNINPLLEVWKTLCALCFQNTSLSFLQDIWQVFNLSTELLIKAWRILYCPNTRLWKSFHFFTLLALQAVFEASHIFLKHRCSPFWQNYGEYIFPYLLLLLSPLLPFWEYTQPCWCISLISLHMNIIFYITENTHNFMYSEIIQESIKLSLDGKCSELILSIQSITMVQWCNVDAVLFLCFSDKVYSQLEQLTGLY